MVFMYSALKAECSIRQSAKPDLPALKTRNARVNWPTPTCVSKPNQLITFVLLQASQWMKVCVNVAHTIDQTIKRLIKSGALQSLPVLPEDHSASQKVILGMSCVGRGAHTA